VTAGGGVHSGGGHTCGETAGNLVYCWGSNTKGQLGNGTTSRRLTPVQVTGATRFSQVSAGASHTCGVTAEAKAYCWGINREGQLGDGTFAKRLAPVPVLGAP
jgi:alpha-tubulin suppressor-like RCC1 family protein